SFLLPLGTFLLARIGIIKPVTFLKQWRFGIVGILLFSAIITPTIDIITMLVVSIPLFVLYLVSILTAFMGGR
ncbi:twin-arginine translocase subunit TatC, partial [bacterium]